MEEDGERQLQWQLQKAKATATAKASKSNRNGKSNRRSFDSPFAKMREQLRSG
jgi:hypothetical protein